MGGWDVYVAKLSTTGTIQWTRTIGGANYESGTAIIQTTDGGYAITGTTKSCGQGANDIYVVKLDPSGNLQWSQASGGSGIDFSYDIIQTTSGHLVVAGRANSFGNGGYDIILIKLTTNGNVNLRACGEVTSRGIVGSSAMVTSGGAGNSGEWFVNGYTTGAGESVFICTPFPLESSDSKPFLSQTIVSDSST